MPAPLPRRVARIATPLHACATTSLVSCLVVACLVAACLAVAGCTSTNGVPVAPSLLVVGVAQPGASASTPDSSLQRVAALLDRASLLQLERNGRVQPALAERFDAVGDARRWRLQLRAGLTFHDGTPLDAAGVRTAIEHDMRDGPTARVPPGLRDIERLDVRDALALDVLLREPSSLLGEALATIDLRGGANVASGAGPFRIVREGANAIDLEAFAGFHHGPPSIDRIELRSFDTPRTAWAALLRGEIGFLYEVAPEAVPFIEPASGVQVHRFLRPFVYVAGFNLRHRALGDARVRRALSLAIDRDAIVRRILEGRGRPAADPVWPLHWAADGAVEAPRFDRGLARRELEAAGLAMPSAGNGPAGPRARLSFTCLVPAGVPLLEGLALAVQRDLFDVGVDMRLEGLPAALLAQRLAAGTFDAYLLDINAFGLGWTYWLWHSDARRPLIDAGEGAADAPLDRMRHARDEAALKAAVADVRQSFRDDPPALFLCWVEAARATSRALALPAGPDRDILLSVARWHPAP